MYWRQILISMKLLTLLVSVSLLSACASGRVLKVSDDLIQGPKVLALDAPRAPWVLEIQNKLRQKGFKVLRWSSTKQVIEQTSETRVEAFNESGARYLLIIDGDAPYDFANRCFGGGYKFNYISTDLVDAVSNETILNVNGSGYSEKCPPLSGSIFSDIANAVDSAWAK